MNADKHPVTTPREVLNLLIVHKRRILAPVVLFAAAAAVYAAVSRPTWSASQALIIRNEATNADNAPGKFSRSEDMKTVQETILELVKSRTVLSGALQQVGPPANNGVQTGQPSDRAIEQLRQAVRLTPPKGAEFGATEVFYL